MRIAEEGVSHSAAAHAGGLHVARGDDGVDPWSGGGRVKGGRGERPREGVEGGEGGGGELEVVVDKGRGGCVRWGGGLRWATTRGRGR